MIRGYQPIPHLAWQGYRLRIPGGPVGGQYHGFIGPDSSSGGWPGGRSEIGEAGQQHPSGASFPARSGSSAGPWVNDWGGTSLHEGQDHSDYVYRSTAELRPRPNASGGVNVVRGAQTRKTPGYAVAPGNYRGLGAMAPVIPFRGSIVRTGFVPGASTGNPRLYYGPQETYPGGPDMWPIPSAGSGATSTVAQPPPPVAPIPGNVVMWSAPPVSPAPAPTVAATPADYLPSQGQTVPGISPAATAPATDAISAWLQASTIIPGVLNQWVALGGIAAAFLLMGGKKR